MERIDDFGTESWAIAPGVFIVVLRDGRVLRVEGAVTLEW